MAAVRERRRVNKSGKRDGGPARTLVAVVLVLGALSLPLAGLFASTSAGADTAPDSFYLDLGGSASVGFQPTTTQPHGELTSDGYADDLVAYEASRGVDLDLTELGCPGETTRTMLYGGDHCYPSDDAQLAEAITFLQDHLNDSGIVTIDLGYNDIQSCFTHSSVYAFCVKSGLAAVAQRLPLILEYLKYAAGPGVTFVGLGHYDPYLADELLGPSGRAYALKSSAAIQQLNTVLQRDYGAAGVPMANLQTAFERGAVPVGSPVGVSVVGNDVVYACELTWMCQPLPFGPDPHPNNAGYAMIAAAIESQLKAPW
jgi:GDSL-like Lipase/Acylhydrolase family